ncbi:PAS-domain containing protein [Palleronia abyssalis]|uniref:Sensor protein DivL n=1 Tax=Palleronia abyssalis TaxID=1501240 RepID=A0A2R8BSN3_9RHOB|nr:PAS-domain containing protein [Palleronia abyssalis]SPJ23197.1 Sensor protein DivL [Palleronia abyssalis]
MTIDPTQVIPFAMMSVATGVVILAILIRFGRAKLLIDDQSEETVFLVDGAHVIDATTTGRMILDLLGDAGWTTDRLLRWLAETFPDLASADRKLSELGNRVFLGLDGVSRLDISPDGDRMRLKLTHAGHGRIAIDRICHDAARAELDALRKLGDDLPQPVWRQDAYGHITWANTAYLDLVRQVSGSEPAWPLTNIMDMAETTPGTSRTKIGADWFELTFAPSGQGMLAAATPVSGLVEAEVALQSFKGTMSRTFAHLTIGLAIFDRTRRLAVFNPALTDLTTLPVPLLVGQPTLETFLDALRARQMMPEPRDYSSWRDRVATVEKAAQNGTYSELWHLPDGRTYRVTGRPQPDGAFALLMEDISAEISLTRSFRAQIETSHSVIDALPDAIAVFDRAGALTMTNTAYDRLWGTRTQDGIGHGALEDAVSHWRQRCDPGLLDGITETLSGTRHAPETELRLDDGRRVAISAAPLPGGSMMVRFALRAAEVSKLMPTRAHLLIEERLKA